MKVKSKKVVALHDDAEEDLDELLGDETAEEDDSDEEDEEEEDEEDEEEEDEEEDDSDEEDEEEEDEEEEDEEEEDDSDEEEEEEEEAPPAPEPVKKGKRAKVYSYYVTKPFACAGREYKAGETISVTCATCAFWQKAINGEVICSPETVLNKKGLTMSEDRFSCTTYYLNLAHADELDRYLELGYIDVMAILPLLKLRERQIKLRSKIRTMAADSGADGAEVLQAAEDWVKGFTHTDEIDYFVNFAKKWPKVVKTNLKEKKLRYTRGSWVSWTDADSRIGESTGIILAIGKGSITIAITEGKLKGKQPTYDFKSWKETCAPKLLRMGSEE